VLIIEYLFALIIGLMAGNFATTALHRLPRGIPIYASSANLRPRCSYCSHELKFFEYLPILSWISAKGSCNYCGHKINPLYTLLETFGALISVLCLTFFGLTDLYIIFFTFGILSLLSGSICLTNHPPIKVVTVAIIVCGMLYKTLVQHDIIHWLYGLSFCCLIVLLYVSRKKAWHLTKKEVVAIHLLLPAILWCQGWWLTLYIVFLISSCKYCKIRAVEKNYFAIGIMLMFFIALLTSFMNMEFIQVRINQSTTRSEPH